MKNFLKKIIGCFFGHKIKKEYIVTREWNQYSPKEGTLTGRNNYSCIKCGKNLTQEIEMYLYYKNRQEEFGLTYENKILGKGI